MYIYIYVYICIYYTFSYYLDVIIVQAHQLTARPLYFFGDLLLNKIQILKKNKKPHLFIH